MSRLLVALLSLVSALMAQNIVLVQLGSKVTCLFTVLEQARTLNPNCPIYLLTDPEGYSALRSNPFLSKQRIALVDMSKIPQSEEHTYFNQINKIDPRLFDGFWKFALDRFFYLYDFVKNKNLCDIVHLENDSMLYVDIAELMPYFHRLGSELAAPFQSMVGCIPCFVYVKGAESLALLMTHIISEMESYEGSRPHIDVNDMQTLASYNRKFGEAYMTRLPVLMPEYGQFHEKRTSNFEPDNSTPLEFLHLNAHLFPGFIFDAATLGVFANGNDRRYFPNNGPGIIHYRSLFDPGHFSFFWQDRLPYLSFHGKAYRIVNMHFHSKLPEGFTSFADHRDPFQPTSHL